MSQVYNLDDLFRRLNESFDNLNVSLKIKHEHLIKHQRVPLKTYLKHQRVNLFHTKLVPDVPSVPEMERREILSKYPEIVHSFQWTPRLVFLLDKHVRINIEEQLIGIVSDDTISNTISTLDLEDLLLAEDMDVNWLSVTETLLIDIQKSKTLVIGSSPRVVIPPTDQMGSLPKGSLQTTIVLRSLTALESERAWLHLRPRFSSIFDEIFKFVRKGDVFMESKLKSIQEVQNSLADVVLSEFFPLKTKIDNSQESQALAAATSKRDSLIRVHRLGRRRGRPRLLDSSLRSFLNEDEPKDYVFSSSREEAMQAIEDNIQKSILDAPPSALVPVIIKSKQFIVKKPEGNLNMRTLKLLRERLNVQYHSIQDILSNATLNFADSKNDTATSTSSNKTKKAMSTSSSSYISLLDCVLPTTVAKSLNRVEEWTLIHAAWTSAAEHALSLNQSQQPQQHNSKFASSLDTFDRIPELTEDTNKSFLKVRLQDETNENESLSSSLSRSPSIASNFDIDSNDAPDNNSSSKHLDNVASSTQNASDFFSSTSIVPMLPPKTVHEYHKITRSLTTTKNRCEADLTKIIDWTDVALRCGLRLSPFSCLKKFIQINSCLPAQIAEQNSRHGVNQWTQFEDAALFLGVSLYGEGDWRSTSRLISLIGVTSPEAPDTSLASRNAFAISNRWTKILKSKVYEGKLRRGLGSLLSYCDTHACDKVQSDLDYWKRLHAERKSLANTLESVTTYISNRDSLQLLPVQMPKPISYGWSAWEDAALQVCHMVLKSNWTQISNLLGRNPNSCLQRLDTIMSRKDGQSIDSLTSHEQPLNLKWTVSTIRNAFTLAAEVGLNSYSQIARALGVSKTAVRALFSRTFANIGSAANFEAGERVESGGINFRGREGVWSVLKVNQVLKDSLPNVAVMNPPSLPSPMPLRVDNAQKKDFKKQIVKRKQTKRKKLDEESDEEHVSEGDQSIESSFESDSLGLEGSVDVPNLGESTADDSLSLVEEMETRRDAAVALARITHDAKPQITTKLIQQMTQDHLVREASATVRNLSIASGIHPFKMLSKAGFGTDRYGSKQMLYANTTVPLSSHEVDDSDIDAKKLKTSSGRTIKVDSVKNAFLLEDRMPENSANSPIDLDVSDVDDDANPKKRKSKNKSIFSQRKSSMIARIEMPNLSVAPEFIVTSALNPERRRALRKAARELALDAEYRQTEEFQNQLAYAANQQNSLHDPSLSPNVSPALDPLRGPLPSTPLLRNPPNSPGSFPFTSLSFPPLIHALESSNTHALSSYTTHESPSLHHHSSQGRSQAISLSNNGVDYPFPNGESFPFLSSPLFTSSTVLSGQVQQPAHDQRLTRSSSSPPNLHHSNQIDNAAYHQLPALLPPPEVKDSLVSPLHTSLVGQSKIPEGRFPPSKFILPPRINIVEAREKHDRSKDLPIVTSHVYQEDDDSDGGPEKKRKKTE